MSRNIVLDVASYQSNFTANDYRKTGATGVIVKLTESTNYTNPYIQSSITNAKSGGINNFAFYHFQRATSVDGLRAEAQYCVNVANRFAKKGDVIFLDAELANAVPSLQAIREFYKVVRNAGYRVGFYTYKFMYPKFTKEVFTEADLFWAAAYPLGNRPTSSHPDFNYFPSQENVGLWQFTDNWKGMNVDASITLDDRLFNGSTPNVPIQKREWYTTKLKQITLKQDTPLFKDEALNEYLDTFKKGEIFNIVGDPRIDSHGHVAYQTESGLFITGDKAYIDSNYWLLASYGGKTSVRLKSKQGLYKDLAFKELVREYEKGTVFNIVANEKSKSGYPRLKTESGFYITSNKKYVEWI